MGLLQTKTMNPLPVLLVAVAALALSSGGTAFGVPSGALSLDGSGVAVMPDGVGDVSLDLTISTTGTDKLVIGAGSLIYGSDEFDTVSIDGSFLRNAKFIQLMGIAENGGESVVVKLLGRLIEEQNDESLYLITGTLGSGNYEGKVVFAASLSQFVVQPIKTESASGPLEVLILAGPRVAGEPDGHLSTVSIQTLPGQSVTITNNDTTSHRLVSGKISEWFYIRDGDPRICDPDKVLDDASSTEVKTGIRQKHNKDLTFVVPEIPEGSSRKSSKTLNTYGCDFIRDGHTDVTIEPGASASVRASEPGFFRLLDVSKPWIQLDIVSVLELRPLG